MSDALLAKCPHCQTLFRIQPEHLAAADGEVRCGACFRIFDAHAWADPATTAQATAINTAPPAATDAAAEEEPGKTAGIPSPEAVAQLEIATPSIEALVAPATTSHHRYWLKWGLLALLALTALITQWLVFSFQAQPHHPQLRPLFASACQRLGCQLPAYQELKAIKTERLSVRPHPDYKNTLLVELILRNTASEPQPMPRLDLSFSAINEAPVAQRTFSPQDYLGKANSITQLPPGTPVHLQFAILDPGKAAVNYHLSLIPAE